MLGLGPTELLLILGIGGLLFGASRLPQLGAGLGEGIRNFKTSLRQPAPEELEAQKLCLPVLLDAKAEFINRREELEAESESSATSQATQSS